MDVISSEEITTYDSLVQEATCEYRDIVDSKWREPDTSKKKSQYQPSLPKAYMVAIEKFSNKALKKVDFKSRRSGNSSGSGGDSSVKLNVTFHKCGKKVHIQK